MEAADRIGFWLIALVWGGVFLGLFLRASRRMSAYVAAASPELAKRLSGARGRTGAGLDALRLVIKSQSAPDIEQLRLQTGRAFELVLVWMYAGLFITAALYSIALAVGEAIHVPPANQSLVDAINGLFSGRGVGVGFGPGLILDVVVLVVWVLVPLVHQRGRMPNVWWATRACFIVLGTYQLWWLANN